MFNKPYIYRSAVKTGLYIGISTRPRRFEMLNKIIKFCMGNIMFENFADFTVVIRNNINKYILTFPDAA
jgi:hypothetical protein